MSFRSESPDSNTPAVTRGMNFNSSRLPCTPPSFQQNPFELPDSGSCESSLKSRALMLISPARNAFDSWLSPSTAGTLKAPKMEDQNHSIVTLNEQAQTIIDLQAELTKYKLEVGNLNRGLERKGEFLRQERREKARERSIHEAEESQLLHEIQKLQLQFSKANSDLQQLSGNPGRTFRFEKELERAEMENGALLHQLQESKSQIEEYKSQIFNMQPHDDVSDALVAQKYESLKQAVSDWVDTELKDASGYMSQANVAALSPKNRKMVEQAFLLGDIKTAINHPDVESLLTEMVIGRYLFNNILAESIHFLGLDTNDQLTLTFVQREVRNPEAVKGKTLRLPFPQDRADNEQARSNPAY
jgi:hypothetical protein